MAGVADTAPRAVWYHSVNSGWQVTTSWCQNLLVARQNVLVTGQNVGCMEFTKKNKLSKDSAFRDNFIGADLSQKTCCHILHSKQILLWRYHLSFNKCVFFHRGTIFRISASYHTQIGTSLTPKPTTEITILFSYRPAHIWRQSAPSPVPATSPPLGPPPPGLPGPASRTPHPQPRTPPGVSAVRALHHVSGAMCRCRVPVLCVVACMC